MRSCLDKYAVILWDFDGVILDSMSIRDEGFRRVLSTYPDEEVAALLNYHRRNGGLSRYVKFRHFFREIRNEAFTEEKIQDLAGQFSTIMLELLGDRRLLIEETIDYIQEQHTAQRFHIVSGSDQRELRILCEQLGIDSLFSSIHGSPTPKTKLVAELLTKHKYLPEKTCLIGDSMNDFEAAHNNGIDFWGFNNPILASLGTGYIHSF